MQYLSNTTCTLNLYKYVKISYFYKKKEKIVIKTQLVNVEKFFNTINYSVVYNNM